ncbi:Uncharacterised protein [Serratia marcescens]|nr:Uncharacterised protein [Serratia marcescens]
MCTAARACRCFHRRAKSACWASNASRSAISASSVSPMTKGWRSFTARRRPGRRRRAASAKSVWRCATAPTTRCCATLKTPPRCTWRSSIIPENGCWICRCSSRTTWPGRARWPGCCRANAQNGPSPGLSCAKPAIRWPRPTKTAWRRSPRPTPIICCAAKAKGCTSFSRGVSCCRATWPARRRCSFSRGPTWPRSANLSWRRPTNTPTSACCALASTTIASRSSKTSTKNISSVSIGKSCWSTVYSRSTAARRRSTTCVWR